MQKLSLSKSFLILFSAILIFILLVSTLTLLSKWNTENINEKIRAEREEGQHKLIRVGDQGIFIINPFLIQLGILALNLLTIILAIKYYQDNFEETSYLKSLSIPITYSLLFFLAGFLPLLLSNLGFILLDGEEKGWANIAPFISFFIGLGILIISATINGIIRYQKIHNT